MSMMISKEVSNMSKQSKPKPSSGQDKLELAKSIANQSKKVVRTYTNIEQLLLRILKFISSWFDKLMYSQKTSKLVSLVLAFILYAAMNFNLGESVFNNPVQSGYKIPLIPVSVIANTEIYEVSGLPKTVSANVVGDLSDISLMNTQKAYYVVADLSGLLEGTHEVRLTPKDFSTRLDVALSQTTAVITIKKKISERFALAYDFVNKDKMNQEFVLGTPVLSDQEVIIRASQDTLDKIGMVKVLIDVTGVTTDFVKEGTVVAYDQTGDRMVVDILPIKVSVSVGVSSPSKSVPVTVSPIGEIPGGLAIDTVTYDHQSITIYGQDSILGAIDSVLVPIDATALTTDVNLVADIPLPSGITKTSVNVVNMQIKLAPGVSKMIPNVIIEYSNNIKGYLFTLVDLQDVYTAVDLFGTQANIESITNEDLYVYFDMKNVVLGENEVQLYVVGPNPLVKYTLVKSTIKIKVTK
jgi:YbbR domain-containing protein